VEKDWSLLTQCNDDQASAEVHMYTAHNQYCSECVEKGWSPLTHCNDDPGVSWGPHVASKGWSHNDLKILTKFLVLAYFYIKTMNSEMVTHPYYDVLYQFLEKKWFLYIWSHTRFRTDNDEMRLFRILLRWPVTVVCLTYLYVCCWCSMTQGSAEVHM